MIFVKKIEGHDKLSFEKNFTIVESLLGDLVPKKSKFLLLSRPNWCPFFANGGYQNDLTMVTVFSNENL